MGEQDTYNVRVRGKPHEKWEKHHDMTHNGLMEEIRKRLDEGELRLVAKRR